MGIASTMLNDLSPEEGDWESADGWSTVLASSRLLLTLINNVLDIGKMDADKMAEIELSSVPVFSPIRESIEFCTHFAALSETKLVFDSPEREWTMMVNRIRLQQVSFPLLVTAVPVVRSGHSGLSTHT
jgi:signal transduction histidine kinase